MAFVGWGDTESRSEGVGFLMLGCCVCLMVSPPAEAMMLGWVVGCTPSTWTGPAFASAPTLAGPDSGAFSSAWLTTGAARLAAALSSGELEGLTWYAFDGGAWTCWSSWALCDWLMACPDSAGASGRLGVC